jgi:hypothetical protein
MNNINVFLNESQYSDPFLELRKTTVRHFPEAEIRRENVPCATAGSLYVNIDPIHHRPIDVIEHMNRPRIVKQNIN